MTEAATQPTPADQPAETFAGIVLRRARYVLAVALCAALFLTLGWALLRPPADDTGVSLLWWGPNFLAAAVMVVLMALAVVVAMFVCHADGPYTGMWCAFMGLAAVAIRGGDLRLLLEKAQVAHRVKELYSTFAMESALWALLIIAAEVVAQNLWRGGLANLRWLKHLGVAGEEAALAVSQKVPGMTLDPAKTAKNRLAQSLGALVLATAVGCILTPFLMQSQDKGQVLFAAFLACGVGAWAARLLAPDAWPASMWMAVPAGAVVGYAMAAAEFKFPGVATSPMGRALPIDYISAGVPGAILGYYAAVRMQVHKVLEDLPG